MTTQIKSFPTKAKIRRALDVIIGAGFEPRAIEITETGAVRVEIAQEIDKGRGDAFEKWERTDNVSQIKGAAPG